MIRFLLFGLLSFLSLFGKAQFTSIHHQQSEFYKQYGNIEEHEYDKLFGKSSIINAQKKACNLNYEVYGWHPYWVGTAYTNYDFNLLSTFSYFSYELNPSTGSYNSIHSWKTSPSIDMALAAGCKVELCVTNFGASNNTTFLTNPIAQQTFIDSIIVLLNYRNATGVNIDFEGISGSNRNDLTNFMISLSNQLKAAIPNATVTMATYSVDWNNVFDFAVLNNYVDQFIIMGYGYYYSGSSVAGPTDPLYSGSIWSSYNLIRSILYHLDEGVSKNKLLIGLPYYGYEFETTSNTVPSSTTGNFSSSRTYKYVKDNASGNYTNGLYDKESETPYFIYQNTGNWRQAFVMDAESLKERLKWVKGLQIAGMGIWALGYDDGYSELWNALSDELTDCELQNCNDTIFDTGGEYGKYRSNEDYTYIIKSNSNTSVSINFLMFDVEAGSSNNCDYDYLEIFDGPDTSATLIGKYCNDTGSPGTILGSGNSLLLRFHSDGATQNNGWVIATSCIIDTIKPTTQIGILPNPATNDFNLNFNDNDNIGGSGIKHQFYQVAHFNGVEWRSNELNGFFNDAFNNGNIHSDWIDSSGIWSAQVIYVSQTDETNTNTNLYTSCNQNGADKYLYQYQMQISGAGSNKRAGFHYMSDDASLPNRGNSYFVWFRQDDAKLQFYKVVNDVFSLEKEVPLIFNANQWYDIKIVYDKITGESEVWMNEVFIASWLDANPITLGNFISLRSGNCIYDVDNVKVYKTRTNSSFITVGNDPSDDIQFAGVQVGRITSHIIDTALNVSTIDAELFDVNLTTSIKSTKSDEMLVYPNPIDDEFFIELNNSTIKQFEIFDVSGKLLETYSTYESKFNINFSNYSKGVYILRITTDDEIKSLKLIKQ